MHGGECDRIVTRAIVVAPASAHRVVGAVLFFGQAPLLDVSLSVHDAMTIRTSRSVVNGATGETLIADIVTIMRIVIAPPPVVVGAAQPMIQGGELLSLPLGIGHGLVPAHSDYRMILHSLGIRPVGPQCGCSILALAIRERADHLVPRLSQCVDPELLPMVAAGVNKRLILAMGHFVPIELEFTHGWRDLAVHQPRNTACAMVVLIPQFQHADHATSSWHS